MLLTRLDVTVQSFRWSERARAQLDDIEKVFQPRRAALHSGSAVEPEDIYLATTGTRREGEIQRKKKKKKIKEEDKG